jgi:hypothetical protein
LADESDYKFVWDDDREPEITGITRTFHVGMPTKEGERAMLIWAKVEVYDHDYCELENWKWFDFRPKKPGTGYFLNKPEDAAIWEAMRKVWEWLAEWEFVELRPTGPEDKEYFALPKLLEGTVKSGYPG